MKKRAYTVEIYQVNKRLITVNADDENQALEIARNKYNKGQIVVDSDYYSGNYIQIMKPSKQTKKGFLKTLISKLELKRSLKNI